MLVHIPAIPRCHPETILGRANMHGAYDMCGGRGPSAAEYFGSREKPAMLEDTPSR